MTTNPSLPQFPEPIWRSGVELQAFDTLIEDQSVDVAILGAGITGITTAYLLSKSGQKVALIDAGSILNGTTGHTTAKITAQHDLIYDELIQHIGEVKAKQYYRSNTEALQFIQNTITENNIDCGFKSEDAYLYATEKTSHQKLQKEFEAYRKLGIDSDLVDEIPFDIPIESALVMKNQAQFHPLRYLLPLVEKIKSSGGMIFENTPAVDIETGTKPKVVTRNGFNITCNHVVIASHFPFFDGRGFYFARMHAEKSYVIAIKSNKPYPGGMYLSVDQPKRSLRDTTINGENYILVGGESHKTGHGINTFKHYENLQDWAETTLGIRESPFRWSTQDLITIDKIPYIGKISSKYDNIFVASGYKKWGMTTSTIAAKLLTDLITKGLSPYEELYTPSRFYADPSLKNLVVQNADVAGHFVAGKVGLAHKKLNDMGNDEGAVVKVNGKRTGAYKDENGCLHLVDTTCTHMGCETEWNSGDRTWDCPCHGSRFSIDGTVVEGPAEKPLKQVSLEDKE
ncbi:FAD-dependent oxidoreductase [Pseudalkalibacillus sp. R45]|uniref:FAD-dependent oxidoreductase n=1 Tax=Pseudalkalibacillus sp. R45 TaxID=3457433 RepID=UPI003FCC8C3B